MAAVRALAPWFGQAQFVWANVIGLILFALALGNVAGGRLADRRASPRFLGALLLVAAGLVAAAAFLPGPVSRALLPETLPLEAAYPFLFKGSFLAALACFGPPVLLLGAVPPFLVRCATRRIEEVGRRTGLLYGASTLGSIAGTFLTTYLLLPSLGIQGTLLLASLLLAAAAAPLLVPPQRGGAKAAVATLVALAAAGAAPVALRVAAPSLLEATPGAALGRLIVARESRYQHLEVRHRDDLPVPARVLAIDEGHDSVQSVTPDTGVLTGLYYDYFTLLALDQARGGRLRVAILGLGGGTHARQLLQLVGGRCELSIVGVELDPEVIALSRAELSLPEDPRFSVLVELDARTFVDHSRERFDLILVDCYHQQSFLPTHVASREFLAAARTRLAPGGVLALNLTGFGASDPVVAAVVNTLAAVSEGDVAICVLPGLSNLLAYVAERGPARLPGAWDAAAWPQECQELRERLLAPGQAFRVKPRPDATILTDDSGTLDRLQMDRLRDHAERLLRGSP
jgi:predicted membrane-bound spermidine synthase